MNILLGIRMVFAGGRESIARMGLMAVGIAIGVPLVLLALAALPILQTHIDRLAWHRTTASSPPTAPDHALWLAVTDHYQGRDIVRVHVAALGPQPPVPPGVSRLPGPGEKLVSPGLAELMRTVPDDQLDNRYPGRVVGGIGPEGLIMPDEAVAIIGHRPDEMRKMDGAYEIQGIEQPGEELDFAPLFGILFAMLAVMLVGPVAVFVAMVTRIGGARREVRFAAVRLAGATRLQTAMLATTETAVAAVAGTVLGWLGFLAARPLVASQVMLGHGMPIFTEDIVVPPRQLLVVMVAVPLLAVLTTLVTLQPVQITPLRARQRALRRAPSIWRLSPIGLGLLGIWWSTELSADPKWLDKPLPGLLSAFGTLSVLVGFFLAGAVVCLWLSRGMARLSRSATSLIVARRIAADPYATFRAVAGAGVALYIATSLGFLAAADQRSAAHGELLGTVRPALDPGVVAVHVRAVPKELSAPLMAFDGVVVARTGGSDRGVIVVGCADLARVTDLACPLPQRDPDGERGEQYLRLEALFDLPYPDPTAADSVFRPAEFIEPNENSALLPIQTLFIPTDGSSAAMERIRTLAAATLPISRSKVRADLESGSPVSVTSLGTVLPYTMIFILLVAACSLTVSAVSGILERRRPFALLRASGMRLGELRAVVLLETGIPLGFTVLVAVGLATLQSLAAVPLKDWILPSTEFIIGLGIGVPVAFAVCLIALPFMNAATSLDSVRYE